MSTIAITGATGVIGSRLTKIAITMGYNVLAFVRPHSANISRIIDSGAEIIECNGNGYATLTCALKADMFMHLAWEGASLEHRDDCLLQLDNVRNSIGAVELAHNINCSSFIFVSSQAEVGITDERITERSVALPRSAYGIAKLAAGQLTSLKCSEYNMRCCRARILSIISEEDDDVKLLNYVAKMLSLGKKPHLTKCEQIWDYLYVDEACKQLLAIAAKGKDGAIYQVCSGEERPLKKYIEMIRNKINPALPLGYGEKDYYPHQPMRLVGDISNLCNDTGYNLDDGELYKGINMLCEKYKQLFLGVGEK